MNKKESIYIKVYNLAHKQNIPKSSVKTIIKGYVDYCKELILNGYRVDFVNLVSVVPNNNKERKTTLAYDCKIVAKRIGMPFYTVYVIIKEYLDCLKEDLIQDRNPCEIRGIVKLTPITKIDGTITINSTVSPTFRRYIAENEDCKVSSVRVHTNKILKYKNKNNTVI